MFSTVLSQISKYNVALIKPYKFGNHLINPVIFGQREPKDLYEYKNKFFKKLDAKKNALQKILKNIDTDKQNFSVKSQEIIKFEIDYILTKIEFLKSVYDIEAEKIDENYQYERKNIDYDYYNKIFFWVSTQDIESGSFQRNQAYEIFLTHNEVKELLLLSKKLIPGFSFRFASVMYMSHSDGVLYIPKKEIYTIREVITLFFHENTHFFREYNQIRNLWFSYDFSDYSKYEEGIALYNEYSYWKKLLWKYYYNPYYDKCYWIIFSDLDEKEKQIQIHKILQKKWFTKEKSLFYYYRFYRYAQVATKSLFLKDIIYTKWYRRVKRLIEKNSDNYERIMAGKIGPKWFKYNYIEVNNNFDSKWYFDIILEKLKEKI